MKDIEIKAKYKANLILNDLLYWSSSPLFKYITHYFNEDMQEIYMEINSKIYPFNPPRTWPKEILYRYRVQEIKE